MSRVSAPRVWGFLVVSLVFSFQACCFPFFPLGASCDVGLPCMPSASLLSVKFLVTLCVFCVRCSFLLSRLSRSSCLCLSASSLPLSVSSRSFCSLSQPFFALPRGVFSSAASPSSSALSSASVPSRRGLLVCLQLRLRRRLSVLLPCPLLWLLPLRLPSGFTSCYFFVVLFSSWLGFAGVLWYRRVLSFSYFTCFNVYSVVVPSFTAGSEYPWGGGGGGHFDAQWSPGLANSL